MDRAVRAFLGIVVAVGWMLLGTAAGADEAPAKKSVAEQLLDIMRAKDVIDEQQYQDLLRQAREEQAERAAPPPAVASAPPPKPEWEAGWRNGFYVNKSDNSVRLKFGGRLENDFAVINESRSFADEFGGVGTGTEFRRARIYFEGGLYEHLLFKAEYDFAEGEVALKDGWAGLQAIPYIERIRIGHMKEPFSIEQMTSDRYNTFMERALPDAFVPGRNTGVMVDRTFLGERIYFGGGAFANTNDQGFAFENGANYNVTARLTGLPIFAEKGARVLHVGLNYSHLFRGEGPLGFSQRPESHLAPRFVNTGSIPDVSGADIVGGELAGVFGPVNFQAEVITSFLNRRPEAMSNPTFWGGYGQVSWFLTGETRDYNAQSAAFSRTAPKHPFSIADGTWGAFELAVRYSHIDLDDKGIRGGIGNDITAALNWYLYSNMRLMFNYVQANRNGIGDASIVQSRVQVDF